MRLFTEVLPDVLVAHTKLPRAMVDVTLRRLKEAGRIPKGFRHAPPLDARDIARIILGLSAMSPTSAVDHERDVGRLPLVEGQFETDVEAAMVGLIEAAIGRRTISHDLGYVRIDQGSTSMEITARPSLMSRHGSLLISRYGSDPPTCGSFFEISVASISAIARELLEESYDH